MHAKVRQGAILEIFGLLHKGHKIVQNFNIWCGFIYLMRQIFCLNSKIAILKNAQNEAEIGPFFQRWSISLEKVSSALACGLEEI